MSTKKSVKVTPEQCVDKMIELGFSARWIYRASLMAKKEAVKENDKESVVKETRISKYALMKMKNAKINLSHG